MSKKKCHISVVGNVATGKTVAARELSRQLSFDFYPEPEGIFNIKFHKNMKRWAFHNQVDYLLGTMQCEAQIGGGSRPSVQDRCSREVLEVFSHALFLMGQLENSEFKCLDRMFGVAKSLGLPEPSLLVYLEAPVKILLQRLGKRNRPQDLRIGRRLLTTLQSGYEAWVADIDQDRLLRWDTGSCDIVADESNMRSLVREVALKLKCS